MSDFEIFFPTGIEHITDLNGIDHILFVTALCLRYVLSDWKKLLILITAFTIGHSVTLDLSALDIINFSIDWTEFLIPLTILITALNNLSVKSFQFKSKYPLIYFYALLFGFIHGMGFSTLLKSMLGRDETVIVQLLAFNLGLEVGQLLIVAIVLLVSFIFVTLLKTNRRDYILFVSGAITALSLQMIIERFPIKQEKKDDKTARMYYSAGFSCISRRTEHSEQSGF